MPGTVELFQSDSLRAYARVTNGAGLLLVTFAHWLPEHRLEAAGFAEAMATSHGIDVICFNCVSNAWWQYREMPAALDAVRQFAAAWDGIVTYGSSMGGYAAIRYAAALGARRAVAISPQYSIDPRKVPFETRYAKEWPQVSFDAEGLIECSNDCDYIALYDSLFGIDIRHVRLIAAEVPLRHARHPLSGHPAIAALDRAGMASKVAIDLIRGTYDHEAARRALRAARRSSDHYWITLSLKLQETGRHRPAIDTAFSYALLCDDKPMGYRWAFARAKQMGIAIAPSRLAGLPESDRLIAASLESEA